MTMAFEQATIGIEKEREFGQLKAAIERVFAAGRVTKYLKALESGGIRIRSFDAVLAAGRLEKIDSEFSKGNTALALYRALTVSDQAQIREFYLTRIEEVDTALRARFSKLYQYY